LFELSRDEYSFIASVALLSLRRLAGDWKLNELQSWPDADRIEAVQALKLAGVNPEPWVDALLGDKDAGVQFETLRWIADEDLSFYLPAVVSCVT
jgi:hypothetical protein